MSDDKAPRCEEALRHLGRYLDGELPGDELAAIAHHLADCYPCADRASFEGQVRALVRRVCAPEHPPSTLIVRVRARLNEISR